MATGNSALATVATTQAREVIRFDAAQRQMIRDMYARGSSDSEFAALMTVAEARGLDPRLQQCHFVKRYDSKLEREVWAVQVSIDGLRSQAESTGDYDGQDEPEYITDETGVLVAARVRVWRKSISRPFVGVAYFDEYVQTKNVSVFDPATRKNVTTKAPTTFWVKMRRTMLAKCAEALAIRKGFPHTAGLYTPEEMGQAENDRPGRAQVEVVASTTDPQLSGGDDDGYTRFAGALAGLTLPISRDQAVQLWRDHCCTYAPAPRVRTENGERVMREIQAATRTNAEDPKSGAFGSTMAFRNAVVHAEHCDAHENYAALTSDVVECTTPEQIAHAWMDHADALAALPADVHAFALAWCGSRVTACEGGPKQGQAWLKKRIAELGGTPPEKPTRGPAGTNAAGDHAVATSSDGTESAAAASDGAPNNTADPEREAIAAEPTSQPTETDAAYRLASLQQAWTDGEVTLETWRAHLATKDAVPAVANSFAANVHKFGRAAEASPYRGVACDRLRDLGVPEFERGAVLDIAMKERAAKSASKAAA